MGQPVRVRVSPSAPSLLVANPKPNRAESSAMLEGYLPILLFILVGIVVGVMPMTLGRIGSLWLGTHRPDAEKLSA